MTTIQIIEFIILAVIVICMVTYYVILAIKNKWLKQLIDTISNAIAKAEKQFPDGHGKEKKKIVEDAVMEKCEELGIPYKILYKLISKLIDTIISHYNIIAK
ncbi:MAG: hypothetical protein RBT65_07340 [Methanolobus sp.]|nr:hypothetical protein [Methanolobus sp.]